MSRLRTCFLAVLATFTRCFRCNGGEGGNDSRETDSPDAARDTIFSRIGGGDTSVRNHLHENTRQGGPTDGNRNMSGVPLGCSETEEQENDEKSSTKCSNIVKVSDTDDSSTSSEKRRCFCEGCKVKIRNKYFRINQLLKIEGDDRPLRDFDRTQSRMPAQIGPNAVKRERCIKSAGMVRRWSEETQVDIPSRPHTAEELHRRLCRQLRRAEQRRRQKSKRSDGVLPEKKGPKTNTKKRKIQEKDVYVPVSRPPTPIPCGGNCLDDQLLFKRRMSEKVAEIIFEVGEDDDEREFTFAKFSALRRSRASERWPRGVTVRCRSLSSIHVIRLYASPLLQRSDAVIAEKCSVREPGRRGTWPMAGKQPEWPTGRTVLHEANRQKRDVHRRSSKKVTRKAKSKN